MLYTTSHIVKICLLLCGIFFIFSQSVFSQPSQANADLLKAAEDGNMENVKKSLKQGAYLETHDSQWQTALMLAATNSHIEIVKLLLKQGAKACSRDDRDQYHFAITLKKSQDTTGDEMYELLDVEVAHCLCEAKKNELVKIVKLMLPQWQERNQVNVSTDNSIEELQGYMEEYGKYMNSSGFVVLDEYRNANSIIYSGGLRYERFIQAIADNNLEKVKEYIRDYEQKDSGK